MKKEIIINSEYLIEKFSNEINIYLSVIDDIKKELTPIKLLFMSKDDFSKLKTIEDIQYIYWLELIERLFIASITTLLRNRKWFNSVLISIINNNFYLFCSSLRCLIESSADSYYCLKNIPATISDNFIHIKDSLRGKAHKNILIEELENILIHFSHAQKLSSSEKRKYPPEFNAKQVIEYLECIKHENEDILILYSKLCQVSHPSSISLIPYLIEEEDGLILHDRFEDRFLIDEILREYKDNIIATFSRPVLLSLISLKLINMLDYKELQICDKQLSFLDEIGVMENYIKQEKVL
jgi:hypothetical protein